MRVAISEEVQTALDAGGPVVALESTILSHGFPWPQNLELAQALEEAVRQEGATPATIAVLDGVPRVGLDRAALERLTQGSGIAKASARDIPALVARGDSGATTVAGTAMLAALAGIRVFATGGIGGVHRGAQHSLDISADLREIARSPVAVVSAGAKAILDLPLTLELLESLGVPVVGFGTWDFPAFYTRTSGCTLPQRVDDLPTLARLTQSHLSLGRGGLLVCNPIPEADALDSQQVEAWIQIALEEAERSQIAGKALTPFLLATLLKLSQGATLPANRALVMHNARLAAGLAVQMCY